MIKNLQKNKTKAFCVIIFLSLVQLSACASGDSDKGSSWNPFASKKPTGFQDKRSPKENSYYIAVPMRGQVSRVSEDMAAVPYQKIPSKQTSHTQLYGGGVSKASPSVSAGMPSDTPVVPQVPSMEEGMYSSNTATIPPVYNPAYPAPKAPVILPSASVEVKKPIEEKKPSFFERLSNIFKKDEPEPVYVPAAIKSTPVVTSDKPEAMIEKQAEVEKQVVLPPDLPPATPVKQTVQNEVKPVVKLSPPIEAQPEKKKEVVLVTPKPTIASVEKTKIVAHEVPVKNIEESEELDTIALARPPHDDFPSLSTVPEKPSRLNEGNELKREQDELKEKREQIEREDRQDDNASNRLIVPPVLEVPPAPEIKEVVSLPPVLEVPNVEAIPSAVSTVNTGDIPPAIIQAAPEYKLLPESRYRDREVANVVPSVRSNSEDIREYR